MRNHRRNHMPRGCPGADLLVVLGEGDLVLDRPGDQFQFFQGILKFGIFGIVLGQIDIR